MDIEYQVKRSSRKSVSIKINEKGQIFVLCPLKFSNKKIEEILKIKGDWIKKVLLQVKQKQEDFKDFYDYKKILLLGKIYNVERTQNQLKIGDTYFKISKNQNIKNLLKKWLISNANAFILKRLDYYSDVTNLSYKTSKIVSARKKWGSCDSLRNINMNFRLVMLPIECIDYVCVHELSHLKYMNHSKYFWEQVGKFVPNYKDIKNIMKKYSFTLELF